MFNPVIIVAIIIQAVIAKSSRVAGAVFGYLITTGILLWGIFVYGQGSQIALFGIPVSETIFLIACLVWYGFDTREFMTARKKASEKQQVLQSPPLQSEHQPIESEFTNQPSTPKGLPDKTRVSITTCPICKARVIPKSDGTCPSCQSIIA